MHLGSLEYTARLLQVQAKILKLDHAALQNACVSRGACRLSQTTQRRSSWDTEGVFPLFCCYFPYCRPQIALCIAFISIFECKDHLIEPDIVLAYQRQHEAELLTTSTVGADRYCLGWPDT
jgi:hypothetical protein